MAGSLNGTVKLPGVGKIKKRELAIAGTVVAGALAYAYYRRATQTPVDEGPLEPLSDQVGLIENTPGFKSTGPAGLYGDTGDDSTGGPGSFQTNGQWHQYVVDYLVQNGTERSTADTAVGKFLDRQKLTSTEANLIRVAQGAAGAPPQGTYTILLETTGGVTQPGTLAKPGAVRNLHVATSERQRSFLTWRWAAPSQGGSPSGYRFRFVSGRDTTVASGTVGPGTLKYTTPRTLTPNRPYRLEVTAYNTAGNGPAANNVAHTAR